MQINRRTSALLSAGVISFAAVVQAEEKATPLSTALASTSISGYVDTSAQWNFGSGNANMPPYAFGGTSKADGFNLNVVQLSISKPMEEGEWAAGYQVDLWFGPDANTLNSTSVAGQNNSDLAIRQAYVALRTPVGNGIDWKLGVFDTIIGYEVLGSPNNPNFTRSYGFTIEPTTHTGIHAGYKINDALSVMACVADTVGPTINGRANPPKAESYKTYMGAIALTAPESWGWAKGSTLNAGVINGFNSAAPSGGVADNQTSWYIGSTLNTPVTGLKVGACFDYADYHNQPAGAVDNQWVIGGYASYQATEKLSFHGRGEYFVTDVPGSDTQIWELTATVQYDLWKNVLSRLEFRWDHGDGVELFGGSTTGDPDQKNATELIASITYKF
jgi:hypothetical protein